jgi:hypothetical protein
MNLFIRIFDTDSQTLWSRFAELLPEAEQELLLHEVELLRPNWIGAVHNHSSVAFGDGPRDRGNLLSHDTVPGCLNCG